MDTVHVAMAVHHVLEVPADEEHEATVVCEAAIVTTIRDRDAGEVSLLIFPAGSKQVEVMRAAHHREAKPDTWHFISECPTGS